MVVLRRHFISFSLSLCITAQEVQTFRLSELRKSENSSMNLYLEEIFLLEPIKKKLGNLSIFEHKLFQKLHHPTFMASIRLLYRQSSLWQHKGPCLMLVDDLRGNLAWNPFQLSSTMYTKQSWTQLSGIAKLRILETVCTLQLCFQHYACSPPSFYDIRFCCVIAMKHWLDFITKNILLFLRMASPFPSLSVSRPTRIEAPRFATPCRKNVPPWYH